MKKFSLLALSALCAMGLTACSDSSSSSPSRSEACAEGLSADCLVGTWKLNGAFNRLSGAIDPSHDFTASPATMTFNEDGTFAFVNSSLTHASCNEVNTYGNWSVAEDLKTLTLKTTVGNACMNPRNITTVPVVSQVGGNIQLEIPQIFFLNSETELESEQNKANTSEIFVIGENE